MMSSDVQDPSVTMEQLSFRRQLATSQATLPKLLRRAYRSVHSISLPAPRVVMRPVLFLFLALRTSYFFLLRVCICEPLFKACCTSYGKNLKTDCFVHWVAGKGEINLGDNVVFDGKSSIMFATRYTNRPVLEVGDGSGIGHGCRLTIGKRITIGKNTTLSGDTIIMDTNAHPTDPQMRLEHKAPDADEVRPVTIGDGVWIGLRCIIFPGVKIGNGSIVSAGSVVRMHVPPYSVVAGNPARVMFRLKQPE
jgi:acetyltransferase-like isoleucine patch superfamily enzyme